MTRPRLLDLFCGAGGASVGYHRAGFDLVGVDIRPQPNYPFEFYQDDALSILGEGWNSAPHFDAIHASPPCQANVKGLRSVNQTIGRNDEYVDLIAATRAMLIESGLPYVIENVEGSVLVEPVRLCGSSFGLPIQRHRLFETSFALMVPPCVHGVNAERKYWNGDRSRRVGDGTRTYVGGDDRRYTSTVVQVYGHAGGTEHWAEAMGINWMTPDEMAEAIPPAYTELVGHQLVAHLERVAA
jgi:DNA (cytosine-5)-methyltransferase 1